MTTTLKAIETVYQGYRFRSRLEARWAVFFDTLGIRYEYEKEGFEFDIPACDLDIDDPTNRTIKHVRYLPDFWLPDLRLWVEIKPGYVPTIYGEQSKSYELARATHHDALMICGNPWPDDYITFIRTWSIHPNEPCIDSGEWGRCATCQTTALVGGNDWLRSVPMRQVDGCACMRFFDRDKLTRNGDIMAAYAAARQARFEHGAHGK